MVQVSDIGYVLNIYKRIFIFNFYNCQKFFRGSEHLYRE